MKKRVILACAALFALILLGGTIAAANTTAEISFKPGEKQYQINEQEFTMSFAPFNAAGRVYVPVDFLGSVLGTGDQEVTWQVGTDMIGLKVPTLEDSFLELKLQAGSKQLVIDYLSYGTDKQTGKQTLEVTDSKTVTMDAAPLVKDGQVYLPVRWVAEACGFGVTWESDTGRVLLTAPGAKDPAVSVNGVSVSTWENKSATEQMDLDLQVPVITGLTDQILQEQINKEIMDRAMQAKAEQEQEYAELAESAEQFDFPLHTFALYVRYEAYVCGDILSLAVETYRYSGGAHGGTWKEFYNLDTKNNELLSLPSLFKDDADYISVINREINKQIAEQKKSGEDIYFDGEMGFQSIAADHPFYFKDNQLVLHFGQYEIAPYASGMPEFAIPLTSLTGQLQERFIAPERALGE